MIIQNITIMNPSESKVATITVYTDSDDSPIASIDSSRPAVVYSPPYEDILNLLITLINTTDNKPVPSSSVQLAIFGCPESESANAAPQVQPQTTPLSFSTVLTTASSAQTGMTIAFQYYNEDKLDFHQFLSTDEF